MVVPLRSTTSCALLVFATSACGQLDPQPLSAAATPSTAGSGGVLGGEAGSGGAPRAGTGGTGTATGGSFSGPATGGSVSDASFDADAERTPDGRVHDARVTDARPEARADVERQEGGTRIGRETGSDARVPTLGPILPPGFDDVPDGAPACVDGSGIPPWSGASDIASTVFASDGFCCALYVAIPAYGVVAVAWPDSRSPTGWVGWQCVDAVPGVSRVTATSLPNSSTELFATGNGLIWVKHGLPNNLGRTTWMHVARPAGVAEIRDIHAFNHTTPLSSTGFQRTDVQLLALSENTVSIRSRQNPTDPYSPFAEWEMVGSIHGNRVCGGFVRDTAGGHIEVYVIDESGGLAVAKRGASDASAVGYSEFTGVAQPPPGGGVVDIDCVVDSSFDLQVVARTQTGLYTSTRGAAAGPWLKITEPALTETSLIVGAAMPVRSPLKNYIDWHWVNQENGSVAGKDFRFNQPFYN